MTPAIALAAGLIGGLYEFLPGWAFWGCMAALALALLIETVPEELL